MAEEVEKAADKFLRTYLQEWEKRLKAAKVRRAKASSALSAEMSKRQWASKLINEAPLER